LALAELEAYFSAAGGPTGSSKDRNQSRLWHDFNCLVMLLVRQLFEKPSSFPMSFA
jgi:hypothetical protein